MKWLYLALTLLIGLLRTSLVLAQFTVMHTASVCVDPPEPPIVVASEKDKKDRYPECKKWSAFFGATEVFKSDQFMGGDTTIPPVNRFARAVIKSWTGRDVPAPSSQQLYDDPKSFALTEVGPDPNQTRSNTLIVWKARGGGMVGYIVEEREVTQGASPLARYQVLYPSSVREGELRTTDAATLARSLQDPGEPKFLRRRHGRFYWNQWIQDIGGNEEPQQIYAGQTYMYHIDFSALDFQSFINNPNLVRDILSEQEARYLVPKLDLLEVTVFPIGRFTEDTAQTAKAIVKEKLLQTTLTSAKLSPVRTLNEASRSYGTLFRLMENNDSSSMVFSFTPEEAGCAHLAVVIWNKARSRVVASWVRPVDVLPNPDNPSDDDTISVSKRNSVSKCPDSIQVAQRFDIAAVPHFDPRPDKDLAARLTFLDFRGFSMGFFEDLLNTRAEPQAWPLESFQGLRKDLAEIKEYVDLHIEEKDFDPGQASNRLERILFSCKDRPNEKCPGWQAREALMQIARDAGGRKVRIQATFRDISNSLYYLPTHLLRIEDGRFLGDAIRIDQLLPMPLGITPPQRPCVLDWVAGFIVQDEEEYNKDDWRKRWIEDLKKGTHYTGVGFYNLIDLRDSFFCKIGSKPGGPEGLVLLAHHGGGKIAERPEQDAVDQIGPQHIKRGFGTGSFAVLAACSVGALGEAPHDNSLFLHTLNEKNVNGAVVSPFKIPVMVAKHFLNALRETLSKLDTETSLYNAFEESKKQYRKSLGPDYDWLIPKVNAFMLIGDGDLKICKPK